MIFKDLLMLSGSLQKGQEPYKVAELRKRLGFGCDPNVASSGYPNENWLNGLTWSIIPLYPR